MRLIKFKGIDNSDYTFETQFTRELIGQAESMDDLPAELYFRASQIVELFPFYEDYFKTIEDGGEPTNMQRQKLMQFINLVLDQIIQDFLRAYPGHLIASEYHPVKGISQEGRLSFHRLAGSMSNLLSILVQMFSTKNEEAVKEEKQTSYKVLKDGEFARPPKAKGSGVGKSKGKKRKVLTKPND